ncbi:MAG: hypothetical protein IJV00_10845, partial [Clostridia bacterium]|nr:hypothetical protein [Clostridia bacterium]
MKKGGIFAVLALVSIIIFLIISIINLNLTIKNKRIEEQQLIEQRNAGKLRIEELSQELNQELTPEVIKKIAREKLNLRDATVIIF